MTVQLFARLRELAGRAEWSCDLPDTASIADVWRAVVEAHPAIAEFKPAVSAALNTEFAPMHATVQDGDEVAFLPPVSGGSDECAVLS